MDPRRDAPLCLPSPEEAHELNSRSDRSALVVAPRQKRGRSVRSLALGIPGAAATAASVHALAHVPWWGLGPALAALYGLYAWRLAR